MEFTFGELFCGAGGMSLGATTAGMKHLWGIDFDKHACDTHRRNFDGVTLCADVRDVDFSTLPDVDCLTFGFPCNDFAVCGPLSGFSGKYGPLYKECVRALEVKKPKIFVAENVKNLVTMNNGETIKTILGAFSGVGYKVYYKVFRFEYYGVPQTRRRIIIVGVRDDIEQVPVFPDEGDTLCTCGPTLSEVVPRGCPNSVETRTTDLDKMIFPLLKYGESYNNVRETVENMGFRCGGQYHRMKYRRLDPSKPSPTITAHGDLDRFVHPTENRWLTNREHARLQTFPDTFVFCGSTRQIHHQIGMSVPPMGVKGVFDDVVRILKTQSC